MAANAVLGGRELDVRLYTPSPAPVVQVVVPATGATGTYNGNEADVTFAIPAPPAGQTWNAASVQWAVTYGETNSFQEAVAGQWVTGTFTTQNTTDTDDSLVAVTAGDLVHRNVAMNASFVTSLATYLGSHSGNYTVRIRLIQPPAWGGVENFVSAQLTLTSSSPQPWQRSRLPDYQVTDVDFEITDQGGFAEGHVTLLANWEDYVFAGNERVDIWDGAGAVLLYRGDLRLPESHLALPETKSLALYGRKAAAGDWLIGRRYVYTSLTDLATVAADLFNDIVAPNDGAAVSDLQATGASVQAGEVLDWTASSLASAMDDLISRAPDQAIWGWDTPPLSGALTGAAPVNRFYVRPRASALKYDFVIGDSERSSIQAFVDPVDTTEIVNRIHITGGKALQPNLANNGGFEHPVAPDEHHGNLLQDGNFDTASTFNYTRTLGIVTGGSGSNPYWTVLNDASFKDTVHPGGGQSFPNDGQWWVSLDQNTETVQQSRPVDRTQLLRAACWVRRGTKGTAATVSLYIDALDSGGTVLGSVGHPSNPFDPHNLPTYLDDVLYQRVQWDVDLSAYTTCASAQFRAVSHSGTNNNDGVYLDTCGLWYRDKLVQQAWISTESGPNSEPAAPVSPAPVVDWVHKPTSGQGQPLSGGYCAQVAAAPVASGWVELQQELYAKIKGKRFQTYTISAAFQTLSGDATVTCGAYAYGSDGSLWAVLESDQFIGGADGNWHSIYGTIDIQDGDANLQPFLRIYSTGTVYFDNVMVVEGPTPLECLGPPAGDFNWWEGAAYEWVALASDPALGLSSDLASSAATYGLRSKAISQPLVIDRPSGQAFATGEFQANAGPKAQTRLTIANSEGSASSPEVGLDGMVRVHGLPVSSAPAASVPVRIRWHYAADSVICDVDLSNRRPDMAYLFLQEGSVQGTAMAAARAAADSGGESNNGSGPYNGGTGGYAGSASPNLSNYVHLAGADQSVSAHTFFKPLTDAVVLGVQREAAGQTSDLMEFYDETGAVLSKVLPTGGMVGPSIQASGLTGAVAVARWVGATTTGHPTAGTFLTGDYVIDQSGTIWICTAAGTPGTWAAPGGLTNPMTTLDDLIVGGTAGAPARLAKGTSGQVLTVDPTSGHVVWDTPASSGGSSSAYQSAVLTDSPTGYWPFEPPDYRDDYTKHGNALQIGSAAYATAWVGPAFASGNTAARDFSPTNAFLTAAYDPSAMDLTGTFSLECWVYLKALPTGERWLVSHGNMANATLQAWGLAVTTTGAFFLRSSNSGGFYSLTSASNLSITTWYHLVATFNAGAGKLYLNGSLNNSGTLGLTAAQAISDLMRIATDDSGNGVFNGYIDELAIYNTELSATRILAHYNAA